MNVRQEKVGTVNVVTPLGPLTDEDGAEFVEVLQAHLESANPHVVLNMNEVSYLDSHALEVLLDAARELRNKSLPLKLAKLTPTCREIFDLTELTGEFEVFDDVEDAVRSFL